jgi:hypothetical protein
LLRSARETKIGQINCFFFCAETVENEDEVSRRKRRITRKKRKLRKTKEKENKREALRASLNYANFVTLARQLRYA